MVTVDALFSKASDAHASDIHCIVGSPPTLRLDGVLQPVAGERALTKEDLTALVATLLTKEEREQFIENRDFDCAWEDTHGQRYRVNLHFERGAMGLAARLIPKAIPSLEALAVPSIVQQFLSLPHGLVLVTGPTGSGKSTTLAAMVEAINLKRSDVIVTLEDPIEFVFEQKKSLIRQRQLGRDMRSFPEGLKHVLRQDPDIIMVGEMRDLETIALTLTLAETGHLVFATLHTYSAAETVERIIDVFPPHQQPQIRIQLASSLRAVMSQQLLPKIGGGRIAAREILVTTPAVSHLIRENKVPQIKGVLQTGARDGMVTFAQDLKRLVKEKKVAKEDAVRYLVGETIE